MGHSTGLAVYTIALVLCALGTLGAPNPDTTIDHLCQVPKASDLRQAFTKKCQLDNWTAEKLSSAIGKQEGASKHPLGLDMMAILEGYNVCQYAGPIAMITCGMLLEQAMDCIQETLRRSGCPGALA